MTEWEELDRLSDAIDSDEADVDNLAEFKSELLDKIHDVERELEKNQEEQGDIMEAYDEVANSHGEMSYSGPSLEEAEAQEEELEERLSELNRVKEQVEHMLSSYRVFDKDNCFNNIRFYMGEKDVKIGQIEKRAGVRKGYMSRLDKPDNTTDPSIQFIATAARMLDVSLDGLLYGHPTEMTDAEKYIHGFLNDILSDTFSHKLRWRKELDGILTELHNFYTAPPIQHPLLSEDVKNLDSDGTPYIMRYVSQFYPDKEVYVRGDVYWTTLPGTENKIYLVPCAIDKDGESDKFYEVYLTDEEGIAKGICTTKYIHSSVIVVLNELIKAAMASSVSVYVEDDVKGIIDAYRRKRSTQE